MKTECNGRLLAAVWGAFVFACGTTTQVSPTGSVLISSDVSSVKNDGTRVNLTARVLDATGKPGTGSVKLSAPYGDMNGTGTSSATLTLDATGSATATYACSVTVDSRCVAGAIIVAASWSTLAGSAPIALVSASTPSGSPDGGGNPSGSDGGVDGGKVVGPPVIILEAGVQPSVLGLKGSGIQESGLMTFLVTDSQGTPVSNAAVTFAEGQPSLVTLGHTSGATDSGGNVVVDYYAGSEVGVTSISATLTANGAVATHAIAVRGAKPSALGFYFSCDQKNLPVYTTTSRYESTTCTVRLSDRFGNRVGISTPVRFASEAGAIDSIAFTKPFDFANPNSPDEGTAKVTFSSDMGNGIYPADVPPLAAAAGQYPWARQAEPQVTVGSLVRNPRDQLVTIIAMTEGEEAFVDANHNGVLDSNEVFYDLGDPFIDANDDGVYDQATPGGLWEVRFCGLNADCSSYHGPNGVWDSQTTIWVPTWEVFSAPAFPSTAPAGGVSPAPAYSPGCVDSKSAAYASVYVYDAYLNGPAMGTTYGGEAVESASTNPNSLSVKKHGFFTELDQWGAMGLLHFDFDYLPVLANGSACAAPASPTAPTACVMRMLFKDFDSGYRGTMELDNATTTAGCPSSAVVTTSIQVTNAHNVLTKGIQGGGTTYAP